MLATYIRRMSNNNLEIRIAGSSFRRHQVTKNLALKTPKFQIRKLQHVRTEDSKDHSKRRLTRHSEGFRVE